MSSHKLSKNFKTSEYFKNSKGSPKNFCQSISVAAAAAVQSLRDERGVPVTVSRVVGGPEGHLVFCSTQGQRESTLVSTKGGEGAMIVYGPQGFLAKVIQGRVEDIGYKSAFKELARGSLGLNQLVAVFALLQLGYKEKKNNRTVFGESMGLNRVPWCAIFYHWLVKQVRDIENSPQGGDVAPVKFTAKYSNSRVTLNKAPIRVKRLEDVKVGYAMVWARTDSKVAGHTAVCVHNDPVNKTMIIVEANVTNKVVARMKKYSKINAHKLEWVGACSYLGEGDSMSGDTRYTSLVDGLTIGKGIYDSSTGYR